MKLTCCVVADLLPLYAEKMTSRETDELIRAHLQECPACRNRLEELQKPAIVPADTDAVPLKKLQKAVRQRRRAAVWAAVLLSLAIAVGIFAALSAPKYVSDARMVALEDRAGLLTVRFGEGVTSYALWVDGRSAEGVSYTIAAGSSCLDRLLGRGQPQPIILNPAQERIASVYYCPMNGQEDVLLYGTAEGGRITLPRAALAGYLVIALAALALCAVGLLIFRKKRRVRTVLLDAALAPACYLTAQLFLCGAAATSTYTLQRDFFLIVLLASLLYAAFLVLHHGILLRREA